MSLLGAFVIIFLIHMSTFFIIQTAFVPDEYWQSLEVAHKIVFHYGSLTWEWEEGLRSYFYPCFIAIAYKVLQLLNMDSVSILVLAPRFLQTFISIISDTFFVSWVTRFIPGTEGIALFSIFTAWFWLFCSSRTLVNTMEASLTTIALYFYPWTKDKYHGSSWAFLLVVGIAGIIRPTAIIPWVFLCFHHIASSRNFFYTLLEYFFVGLLCLCFLLVIDFHFYNNFVITPFNFLLVNVLRKVSEFYGTHSTWWYLANGVPCVFGLHLFPFVLEGVKSLFCTDVPAKITRFLLLSVLFTVGIYSWLPHKEFRFILPLVPMALFVSCSWFSKFQKSNRYIVSALYAIFALVSSMQCLYFGLFHQRGTLDVMQDLAYDSAADPDHTYLMFLMPCHSTPLYSHLHINVSTRYLTCDPRDIFDAKLPRDEADEFYHSPVIWLEKNLNWFPSHVIMFDVLYPEIEDFFSLRNYSVYSCYYHAFLTEGRVGQAVFVLKQRLQK